MKRYINDPRQITVKYTGCCAECGSMLKRGSIAIYWPSDGKLYCSFCGEAEYNQFLSSAMDEEVYHSAGNPLAC